MKKVLFLLISLFCLCSSYASDGKKYALGVAGGYDGYGTAKGEVYFQIKAKKLLGRPLNFRLGISTRAYDFEFEGIKNLKATSVGYFADASIYPFHEGFFVGLRLELANLNWVKSKYIDYIESATGYDVTPAYIGSAYYVQAGYDIKLTETLGLKLYGNAGLHRYTISDGVYSYWGLVIGGDKADSKNKFNYNLNLSFEVRF